MKEFIEKFNIDKKGVEKKGEAMYDWCKAAGKQKKYKDFRALLRNAIRKDFGERVVEAPKPWQEPVNQTKSAEGLKKLAEIKKSLNFNINKK